jgi:hypothetical protein
MATTAWIIRTAFLLNSSWPALAGTPGQVTIFVYDLAHVGSKTLEQAENLTTGIFMRAELSVQWRTDPAAASASLVSDFTAVAGGRCASPFHSAVIKIQLLSHAPNGFAPQALGFSLPCAQRGVQVTIFADRVEAISHHTLAPFYRVLGYGLAHELGHVLLLSSAHEESGLMKAVWSKGDWQRAAVAIIPFTPDQARQMADSLQRIERPQSYTVETSPGIAEIQGSTKVLNSH